MDRLLRLGGGMPGLSQAPPASDAPVVDTAEQVYISSLALLKMLKHGRAGVPMEVMGLMLGKLNCFSFLQLIIHSTGIQFSLIQNQFELYVLF